MESREVPGILREFSRLRQRRTGRETSARKARRLASLPSRASGRESRGKTYAAALRVRARDDRSRQIPRLMCRSLRSPFLAQRFPCPPRRQPDRPRRRPPEFLLLNRWQPLLLTKFPRKHLVIRRAREAMLPQFPPPATSASTMRDGQRRAAEFPRRLPYRWRARPSCGNGRSLSAALPSARASNFPARAPAPTSAWSG